MISIRRNTEYIDRKKSERYQKIWTESKNLKKEKILPALPHSKSPNLSVPFCRRSKVEMHRITAGIAARWVYGRARWKDAPLAQSASRYPGRLRLKGRIFGVQTFAQNLNFAKYLDTDGALRGIFWRTRKSALQLANWRRTRKIDFSKDIYFQMRYYGRYRVSKNLRLF